MKGIVLAGGSGTRLHPITIGTCKQLLPVYDKPLVYYPLSTLMLAGVREILLITTPQDSEIFRALLGDGSQWGLSLSYCVQQKPEGLAQALILAEKFLGGDQCILTLGDNIFFGQSLKSALKRAVQREEGATVFAYAVKDPERFGVLEFDDGGKVISIEEKPARPKSRYAATGLYVYDSDAPAMAKQLKPSKRGELEITDLNQMYLDKGRLNVEVLGRGEAWLDAGTPDSLLEAAQFVRTLEHRQSLKICCPEELAWRNGWITSEMLEQLGRKLGKSEYGRYLLQLLKY